jgi:hypothetical protein
VYSAGKTAYIEKQLKGFVITIMGKRNSMVPDPISLFMKGTYIGSTKNTTPRSEGNIDGLEIPNRPGSYKIMKGNAISIFDNKLQIKLYCDNHDD